MAEESIMKKVFKREQEKIRDTLIGTRSWRKKIMKRYAPEIPWEIREEMTWKERAIMKAAKELKTGPADEFTVLRRLVKRLMGEKGGELMGQIDELDFERIANIAKGFGWEVKKKEIGDQYLKLNLEKLRVEPETDITVMPS